MLLAMSIPRVGHAFSLLSASLLQIVLTSVEGSSQPPAIVAVSGRTAESVVRELGARETSILIDAERFVPLEEQTGRTSVRYSD